MPNQCELKSCCPYGHPIFAVCSEAKCRQPAIICENGYYNNDECGQFHETCSKVLWSKVQGHINHNPNVCFPDFQPIKERIDGLFIQLLKRIKTQHSKFRYWVKTYGYSLEIMKFVKSISEQDFEHFTGAYLSPILNELFNAKRIPLPTITENDVLLVQKEALQKIDRISQIYLRTPKREKSIPFNLSQIRSPAGFSSKIIRELNVISTFFEDKISEVNLIFRASENAFSVKEFHKKCDGVAGTVVLLQTEFGKIIGGYTPVPWSSAKKQWASDKTLKSFLFSINMKEKFPLTLVQFAIANNPEKGPIFGCCDICIVNNAHKERSNAQFPISYNNGKYVRSPDASYTFTGHPKGQFLIKEWQVFKINFQ